MATGREKFKKNKSIINFLVKFFGLFPKKMIWFLLRFFRNTNGKLGLLIRYLLVKNLAKQCGDNVSIQPNVFLFNLQNVSFGNNISIHPMCYIDGCGGIEIGNNVSIAHSSTIISSNHTWDDIQVPIKYNKETHEKVVIQEDVWIGCGCRILAGVHIDKRVVIAAGAVVAKNAEQNAVYGGVPAKLLKRINE
jgi:acetyltransferase-like isoleucine patch superfamily enzyme